MNEPRLSDLVFCGTPTCGRIVVLVPQADGTNKWFHWGDALHECQVPGGVAMPGGSRPQRPIYAPSILRHLT